MRRRLQFVTRLRAAVPCRILLRLLGLSSQVIRDDLHGNHGIALIHVLGHATSHPSLLPNQLLQPSRFGMDAFFQSTHLSPMFDAVVFAGGGNRCYWQGGFYEAAATRLGLSTQLIVGASAGAFAAVYSLLETGPAPA